MPVQIFFLICEIYILIESEHFKSPFFHHWNYILGKFLYQKIEIYCIFSAFVFVINFLLKSAQIKVDSQMRYHKANTLWQSAPRSRSCLFVSFFSKLYTFISFSCLITLARTFSTVLKTRRGISPPCLIPSLKGKL